MHDRKTRRLLNFLSAIFGSGFFVIVKFCLKMGSLGKPFHSVSFGDEEVHCVSFSPYEWSSNLLAIGTKNKVAIASIHLQNVSN